MLASAGSLAFVLAHDAVGSDARQLAQATVGDQAMVKGTFAPYLATPAAADARWAPVHAVLANQTYVLLGTDPGLVVLVTSEPQHADLADAIVHGAVALRMPHPDGSGRTLLVLRATQWDHPLVFG